MRTDDLVIVQSNATITYAEMINNFLYKFRYGINECTDKTVLLKEVILYQWVLNYWFQYEDGTPVENVNHITQEQFNTMIVRLKELTQ